jgi:hypothetical protein
VTVGGNGGSIGDVFLNFSFFGTGITTVEVSILIKQLTISCYVSGYYKTAA